MTKIRKRRPRRDGQNNPQYKFWHEQVLARDNHQCLSCGKKSHVYVWSVVPEFNYDVANGVTLCTQCKNWIKSGQDFEWICRCLIVDQKFNNKGKGDA
jgi:uncharacterized protein with PIN domain